MPRDGSATRNRILDAAQGLVIENGYAATSLDQVIAASGTSKGAFFHHFDSKLALAQSLVERYAAADVGQLHLALEATADIEDPARRVAAFVGWFEESAEETMSAQSNCLYVSILTERQLVTSGTSEPIVGAVEAWREGIADLLRAAAAARPALAGDEADLDWDAWADHVFVTFEGAFLLCRTTGDPGHMRRQLRVLRQSLEAVLGLASVPA